MTSPQPIEITIASLGNLGDGIADVAGIPIFVKKSAAGDHVRVQVSQSTKQSMRGEIVEILNPSPERATPPCPYHAACGGCGLQQLKSENYQAFKQRVLASALGQAGISHTNTNIHFCAPASRRRAEFKLVRSDGHWQLAYNAARSHALVAIDQCLILHPTLQKAVTALRGQLEHLPMQVSISELSLTLVDQGVDLYIEYKGLEALPPRPKNLSLPVSRITARAGRKLADWLPANLSVNFGGIRAIYPQNAFLQASIEGQEALIAFTLAACAGKTRILDLFCGIGTFSLPLAKNAEVTGFEVEAASVAALNSSARLLGLSATAEAQNLHTNPLGPHALSRFDMVVINPPRAGAEAQIKNIAASTLDSVVMISCNPASFARDAKILIKSGFTLTSLLAVDQFVYTPHLEIAGVFRK